MEQSIFGARSQIANEDDTPLQPTVNTPEAWKDEEMPPAESAPLTPLVATTPSPGTAPSPQPQSTHPTEARGAGAAQLAAEGPVTTAIWPVSTLAPPTSGPYPPQPEPQAASAAASPPSASQAPSRPTTASSSSRRSSPPCPPVPMVPMPILTSQQTRR